MSILAFFITFALLLHFDRILGFFIFVALFCTCPVFLHRVFYAYL